MWMRALLGVVVTVAACKSKPDDSAAPAPAAAADPAAADRPGRPLPVDVAELPELRLEALDDRRWVIDDAVLAQLAIDAASGQLRARFDRGGVKIEEAPAGSTLARLGLQAGDVIESVGGQPVADPTGLRVAWAGVRKNGSIAARVTRAGQTEERRYYLYAYFADQLRLDTDPIRDRFYKKNPAGARVLAALKTGVKRTGADTYDVDAKILALAGNGRGAAPLGEVFPGFGTSGVRLLEPESIPGALGLTRYDIIKAVDTHDLHSFVGLAEQLGRLATDKPPEFTISVIRVADPVVLRYRVVTDLVMDAELDAALAAWRAEEEKLRPPAIDPLPPPAPTGGDAGVPQWPVPDDIATLLDRGIRTIDDTHYEIDRDLLDKVLDNPMTIAKGARIVPSIKDGKANGFKLYAIRPSSAWARLGLNNGDTIHAVNGFDVSSPDRALEVYTKVRDARRVKLSITRRGKPIELSYRIR